LLYIGEATSRPSPPASASISHGSSTNIRCMFMSGGCTIQSVTLPRMDGRPGRLTYCLQNGC
jgi:hypothetical protein